MSISIYQPYVYELTFLPTGQRYIGCEYKNSPRAVAHPDNFWSTYFTSSPAIQELRETHDDQLDWSYTILSIHETAQQAITQEYNELKKHDAANNPEFFNNRNGGIGPVSEEAKKKIGDANRGRVISEEKRKNMREGQKGKKYGPPSQEKRDKISKSLKGHKISQETRDKISATCLANNYRHDDATKKLISEASKRCWASKEYRDKRKRQQEQDQPMTNPKGSV